MNCGLCRIVGCTLIAGVLCGGWFAQQLSAQGTRADYERAENLPKLVRNKVVRSQVKPHWFADNSGFWYRVDLGDGQREFVVVNFDDGKRRPAFDHVKLAKELSKAAEKHVSATRLPIDAIEFTKDASAVWFRTAGSGWLFDSKTKSLTKIKRPADVKKIASSKQNQWKRPNFNAPRRTKSPDDKWETFLKDHNLHLRMLASKEEFRLTTDGTDEDAYSPNVFWSPDSKKLVAYRTKKGFERIVHFVESSPKDQVQPKLHSRKYLKPGDAISMTKPHLFDVDKRKQVPVSDERFPNPWRLSQVRWDDDSGRFTFRYNQRGHQVLRVIAVDAETGESSAIIDEQSKTFIDYSFKQFLYYLDDSNEIIWASERDGWNHLYLYDSKTGKVKNQITCGPWVMRGVDRVDEDDREIWFRASGIHPDQDPYYIHHCRIKFNGSGLVVLTQGGGTHEIQYSPDRTCLIDTYSRVDVPPVTELRRASDGALVCELEKADMSALLETGWRTPEQFAAKARDGKTDIHGVIFRPTSFDAKKTYPVIEMIYAGPHGSFVPKKFQAYHRVQSMAELGFIVVRIDGMGTSNRSKAFHDVCWKNLGDSGFPDRILWIKAAAKKYPCMDLTRVGIYGGSAGGQSSTRALLAHGDFYHVAVSDCGCHDNRMDKIWWNEQWMGWPVGPHYAEQSNVTQAHKLKGKLFLIVGEMDTNVDPASTMQVVNALIKADKDFDLLVVPGAGHGIGGSYGVRRRRDFFVRHLLGVEPRGRSRNLDED